ncbi:MAG: RNA methyltransferase, TrmA family [candidate division Zixibacteria bacterium RBG-1]|nr:MAG: RNA methyltransferase, TrmA family [candidate division Zixibacteria bacterium RBG-1]
MGGKGIAKVDDFTFFVESALPGDLAKAQITRLKPNYAEAKTLEIVSPSSFRVQPCCSHFGICGGCAWQNLDYPRQVKFKTKQVQETLEHIGGFLHPPVNSAIPSPEIFFYRNKMEFSFSTDHNNLPVLGLHKKERFDLVFNLDKCYLQSEISNRIVQFIQEFVKKNSISIYDLKTHQGLLRFLTIREGKNSAEIMVNIVTDKGNFPQGKTLAQLLSEKFPQIKSVVRNINPYKAQIAVGEKEELLAGKNFITEKIGDFVFEISANSFFQTNTKQAEKLYEVILRMADLEGKETVLDLYSGTGAISFYLAQKSQKVVGVESNPKTVQDAKKNAELNKISNCQFICEEAKTFLALALIRREAYDLVVIDPPRAGLHPQVVENILKLAPPKIVYVSCNPATLARDLELLCEEKYLLELVQPLDMFPHTFHIESVAKLAKK